VLRSGNAPANGSFDFQFQLFNAASGGTQRGPTLLADNVSVSQGRFTTILNFGNIFGNEALWLAVGVRTGTSTGSFTALSPRQSLTAVPFARYAATSGGGGNTAALEARIAALEALLAGVTREDDGNTIRVTGANLQVVNGTGATDGGENGLGNVIIGYNEPHPTYPNSKTGSHYLVVGKGNAYELHGGIVAGENNYVYGWYSSVLGGQYNEIDADFAAILGGQENKVWSSSSTISGGRFNSVLSQWGSVSGGAINRVTSNYGAVSGGYHNEAKGLYAVVSGGRNNWAEANVATVGGGHGIRTGGTNTSEYRWFVNNKVEVPNLYP